jgi:hypothetical protein
MIGMMHMQNPSHIATHAMDVFMGPNELHIMH